MAMVNSYTPKRILLKDYLLDDLSSCSSNGFRSFPRCQCCASTVGFLVNNLAQKQKTLKKTKPKSFLKMASAALVSAATKPPSSAVGKPLENSPAPVKCLLKRLSRRLKRWRSTNYFAVSSAVSNPVSNIVSEIEVLGKSNGDGGINFSSECNLKCTSGGTCLGNDVVLEEVGNREDAIVAASASSTTPSSSPNKWQNEEAKEQLSPVSVMDFPSTDEEEVSSPEEVSSHFQSRLVCVEGRKKKIMQKLRKIEGLAKLEPIDLSKRFTLSQQTDESIESSSSTASVHENITYIEEEIEEVEEKEKNEVVYKAIGLLDQMKTTFKNYKFDLENLFFDFFIEGVCETNRNRNKNENELVFEARDWMNGNSQEMFLGLEEDKNRLQYKKDMEKRGVWNIRNIRVLDEQKNEVAFELEVEVLVLMVDELVLDLIDV